MVSMAGVAIAAAAIIVVMSVFNGFHALIESRLNLLDPPLTVLPAKGKVLANADSLAARIQALPEMEQALPVVEDRALAMFGSRQMAVKLHGIPQPLYSRFDSLSLAGTPFADYLPGVQPAVVSVGVANQLQLPVGGEQLLALYVPRRIGRIAPTNPMGAFRADSVSITSAFALNQPEYDADALYVPLTLARDLLQYSTEASAIQLYPTPGADPSAAVQALLPPDAKLLSRIELQAESFRIVNMEKWITFLLLGFIMAIASFNIISSLSLLIIEKRDNARTLAALGLTPSASRRIYLLCGIMITGLGGLLGTIAGTLLSLGQQHFGWIKLAGDPAALSITAYPIEFHPLDLLPALALVLLTALLASLAATHRQ